jgi:DNA-binding transcriptional LysR family regulator
MGGYFMDYNSLKYVITVHKHQSISKAANELYLSQPNISKAIQNIEKETGITIFTRTSKGVITTPIGKEFIKKAIELIKKCDEFSSIFTTSRSKLYTMNIAHPKNIYYQTKIIDFSKEFINEEKVNINVIESNTDEIIDLVLKEQISYGVICVHEIDLAYYKKLLSLNNLEFIVKTPQQLKVIVSSNNPLSKLEFVDRNILEKQTLIIGNSSDYHKYYNEKFNFIFSPKVIKTSSGLNQLSILSKYPESYILSLALPDEILKQFDVKMIDFKNNNNGWYTVIIHKKQPILTEVEQKFINFL